MKDSILSCIFLLNQQLYLDFAGHVNIYLQIIHKYIFPTTPIISNLFSRLFKGALNIVSSVTTPEILILG